MVPCLTLVTAVGQSDIYATISLRKTQPPQPHHQNLSGVHLIGVHVTGICLMGAYLMGMHLTGVYPTDVHLMGVQLMGMYLKACISWVCTS